MLSFFAWKWSIDELFDDIQNYLAWGGFVKIGEIPTPYLGVCQSNCAYQFTELIIIKCLIILTLCGVNNVNR